MRIVGGWLIPESLLFDSRYRNLLHLLIEHLFYSYVANVTDQKPLPKVYKSSLMRDVEVMFSDVDIRWVLIDLYNKLGSQKAVAKRLGLSQATIVAWFKSLGIVIRQRHEAVLDPKLDRGLTESSKR